MQNLFTRTTNLFSDCTRDKLLKNSLELFNRKGFVEVTTSLLAASAKVRDGRLWYHFKSKKINKNEIKNQTQLKATKITQ